MAPAQQKENQVDGERFGPICRIPLELQRTGASVRDAVRASGYAALRGGFSPRELADYLRQHPELVEAWAAYSEDKRAARAGTSGGRPRSVGSAESRRQCESCTIRIRLRPAQRSSSASSMMSLIAIPLFDKRGVRGRP
jgi:hypothetical protein